MSFFAELKRRNVFKVLVAYVIVGWLLIQVASIFFPTFNAPNWVMQVFIAIVILGFPIVLIITWAFELTPEGIKPTRAIMPAISKQSTQDISEQSIAILPFVNMSEDPTNEYFSDGIAEELLNRLAKLRDLHVAGRTSSFYFKGKNEDFKIIAERLGVAHILEGSVRKFGNRVRITTQLIKASDGYHLWSETYDRTLEDIFAIQDDISHSVANALQITLGVGDLGRAPGMTRNVEAYDTFLAGRSFMSALGRENVSRAIELFERAVSMDPGFAVAWNSLAGAYDAAATFYITDKAKEYSKKAEAATSRAIDLAPNSLSSLSAAAIRQSQRHDWLSQEEILKKALELAPADYNTNMDYAFFLVSIGRPGESIEYFQRATRAEPLFLTPFQNIGMAYGMHGDYSAALKEFEQAQKLVIGNTLILEALKLVVAMAMNDRALIDSTLEKIVKSDMLPPENWSLNPTMRSFLDTPRDASPALHQFYEDPAYNNNPFVLNVIGIWAAYYSEDILALQAYKDASKLPAFTPVFLWSAPLKKMRCLPDFKTLVRELNLVDYWRKTGNWGEFCRPVGDDDFECN